MSNEKDFFYRWLKNNLSVTPSKNLDHKILSMASAHLAGPKDSFFSSRWKVSGAALLASFLLIFALTPKENHQKELSKMVLNESPEMIMNYKTIELMADSSALSDEEWNKIEGVK